MTIKDFDKAKPHKAVWAEVNEAKRGRAMRMGTVVNIADQMAGLRAENAMLMKRLDALEAPPAA